MIFFSFDVCLTFLKCILCIGCSEGSHLFFFSCFVCCTCNCNRTTDTSLLSFFFSFYLGDNRWRKIYVHISMPLPTPLHVQRLCLIVPALTLVKTCQIVQRRQCGWMILSQGCFPLLQALHVQRLCLIVPVLTMIKTCQTNQ